MPGSNWSEGRRNPRIVPGRASPRSPNALGFRVNDQWRLVFGWDGSRGEAEGVYLDDHSYR
jgi:hypothetical protein